jgi:hypothetical protein
VKLLQLATHLPAVAEYLWQHFFQGPSSDKCTKRRAQVQDMMAGKGSIDELFDMVVAQPVNAAMPCDSQHAVTPPVFVQIDALDELKAGLGRIQFLQLVGKLLPSLPPHVRIIITSRPEKDIVEHLVHRIRWVERIVCYWCLYKDHLVFLFLVHVYLFLVLVVYSPCTCAYFLVC